MSFIHNRTGIALCAAAIAMVLLGAGCQKQGYQPNSGRLDQGTNPTSPSSDATSTLPTQWTEYRSEKLGITIPYPEGWYVEESEDGRLIDLYDRQPIPDSDMPARAQLQVSNQTVDEVRATFPEVVEESTIDREQRSVLRIVHPRDVEPATDEAPRLAYLWVASGKTLVFDGTIDDPTFEEMLDRLLRKDGAP
ncbi:MAG: hypothetical protein Q7R80_03865 [bacterium]|nr:hypothetical protein [bacterium]